MRTVIIAGALVLMVALGSGCSDSRMEEEVARLKSELQNAQAKIAEEAARGQNELKSARAKISELEEKLQAERRQAEEIREELQRVQDRIFTLRVNWEKAGEKAGSTLESWYRNAGEGLDALNEEIKTLKEKVLGSEEEPGEAG